MGMSKVTAMPANNKSREMYSLDLGNAPVRICKSSFACLDSDDSASATCTSDDTDSDVEGIQKNRITYVKFTGDSTLKPFSVSQ